ncbi:WD40 repeat-like protein [Meredithblackwellia eburnea MCA 4105]
MLVTSSWPSSLPLSAPNRPIPPPPLLPHLARLHRIATLGPDASEILPLRSSHSVVKEVEGHTGCVNALDWERGVGSQARLASAGDDTKICIWSPNALPSPPYDTTAPDGDPPNLSTWHPPLSYALQTSIATGHRANIFSIRWAPGKSERIISAAGDSTVRVFDLPTSSSSGGGESVYKGSKSWTHYPENTACVRVLRCHNGRVKRLATESSPDNFLSCGEDGTVRQHDLRTPHTCSSGACPQALVRYSGLQLYSLSISTLRPHLFAVAGTCQWAFLHDRRMLRDAIVRDWGVEIDSESSHLTQCVRRFGVPTMGSKNAVRSHIVASKLGEVRCRDLIVSYSGDAVYLFDTDAEPYSAPTPILSPTKTRNGRHQASTAEHAVTSGEKGKSDIKEEEREERGDEPEIRSSQKRSSTSGAATPADSDGQVDRQKRRRRRGMSDLEPLLVDEDSGGVAVVEGGGEGGEDDEIGPHPSRPTRATGTEEGTQVAGLDSEEKEDGEEDLGDDEDEDDEEEEEEEEEEAPFFRPQPKKEFEPHIPLVAPCRSFKGHANDDTVKDVNYAFRDEAIVSGSDDGNWFCWDKESGQLRGIFCGDESVVNVLQQHPRLPVIAISGIDTTVKLFGPSLLPSSPSTGGTNGNLLSQAASITKLNEGRSRANRSTFSVGPGAGQALLQLLARQLPPEARSGVSFMVNGQLVRLGGDGDGDGDEGDGERGECLIM